MAGASGAAPRVVLGAACLDTGDCQCGDVECKSSPCNQTDCEPSACYQCLKVSGGAATCFRDGGPCQLGSELCQPARKVCTFFCDSDEKRTKCQAMNGRCESGAFRSHCVF